MTDQLAVFPRQRPTDLSAITGFGYGGTVWPALVDKLRAYDRPVTVWSAGCQIGCETYTLAMHVLEAGLTGVRIQASDALAAYLDIAHRGLYFRHEVLIDVKMGRLSRAMFERYFRPVGRDFVQVVDEVRALVEFLGPIYVPDRVDPADVVLLRNIWVHITPDERCDLVRQLAQKLPADGLVVFRLCHPAEVDQVMPRRGHKRIYGRPDPHLSGRHLHGWRRKLPHDAADAARR